ncbi:MAG: DUF4301 family protein [Candidatus Gracilibacteria bacterium]|nr:DUF4301 family protein [Candidatus Gracilibacteria bacterium]
MNITLFSYLKTTIGISSIQELCGKKLVPNQTPTGIHQNNEWEITTVSQNHLNNAEIKLVIKNKMGLKCHVKYLEQKSKTDGCIIPKFQEYFFSPTLHLCFKDDIH